MSEPYVSINFAAPEVSPKNIPNPRFAPFIASLTIKPIVAGAPMPPYSGESEIEAHPNS